MGQKHSNRLKTLGKLVLGYRSLAVDEEEEEPISVVSHQMVETVQTTQSAVKPDHTQLV